MTELKQARIDYLKKHWNEKTITELARDLGVNNQYIHTFVSTLRSAGMDFPKKSPGGSIKAIEVASLTPEPMAAPEPKDKPAYEQRSYSAGYWRGYNSGRRKGEGLEPLQRRRRRSFAGPFASPIGQGHSPVISGHQEPKIEVPMPQPMAYAALGFAIGAAILAITAIALAIK